MSDCPICNQSNTCHINKVLISCRNAPSNKRVPGYRVVSESVRGDGWVWEAVPVEPEEQLEKELENIVQKHVEATDKVTELTQDFISASGDDRKEIRAKLQSAKSLSKNLNDVRIAKEKQLKRTKDQKKKKDRAERSYVSDLSRPKIFYTPENIPLLTTQVLNSFAVLDDPKSKIYYQGGSDQWLCRILQDDGRSDVIEILNHDKLKNSIDNRVSFFRIAGEDEAEVPLDCPLVLSKHILSESRWPLLQKLEGISNIPLLQLDGSIVSTPGYDEGTGYLLEFNAEDFKLMECPTKEDAIKSLDILKEIIKESEFKTEVDRTGALAMFLTAVSRKLYDLAPLFAVDATRPGIGKGTLIEMVTMIVTGEKAGGTLITFDPDETEFKKKLLSTLMEGLPILNIDNVKDGELGGATIESALTTGIFKERFLGLSKNIHVSTKILWTANGNNLRLSKDMQRRSIIIKLDSNVPNLDQRSFSMSDYELSLYLKHNRAKLVSAALTVLQAFLLAQPVMDWPKPIGSFAQWDFLVRRALLWLEQEDPVKTQEQFKAEDDTESEIESLLTAWHDVFGKEEQLVKNLVAKVEDKYFLTDPKVQALRSALMDFCYDYRAQMFNTRALANKLRDNKGTMAGPYKLIRSTTGQRADGSPGKKGSYWYVERVEEPSGRNIEFDLPNIQFDLPPIEFLVDPELEF
jgi:hypothetical protein